MRHLVHDVKYSMVPVNSSVLTLKLPSSVATSLVLNGTKYSVFFITLNPSSSVFMECNCLKLWSRIYRVELRLRRTRKRRRGKGKELHETKFRVTFSNLRFTPGVVFSTACPEVYQNLRGTLESLVTCFVLRILPFLPWILNHPHSLYGNMPAKLCAVR
jgi:hypothetical protein